MKGKTLQKKIWIWLPPVLLFLFSTGCQTRTNGVLGGHDDKTTSGYWVEKGKAWMASERCNEAIHAFSKAVELDPRNAEAYYNRGYAWKRKADLIRALVDMETAHKLMPEDLQIKVSLDILREEYVLETKGKDYFQKRLMIKP